jgi:hypothetical protein
MYHLSGPELPSQFVHATLTAILSPKADAMRALLSLMLLFAALGSAAADQHKRVMILHSVGREFRPWNEYAKYNGQLFAENHAGGGAVFRLRLPIMGAAETA